jgi:hypothetical protein
MIVENFTIAPIPSDDVPQSSAGASPASASGRTFILRPVTPTDPKTGVVSPTNYVEAPGELEAAWNLLTIANAYRSQADQLFDLVTFRRKNDFAK